MVFYREALGYLVALCVALDDGVRDAREVVGSFLWLCAILEAVPKHERVAREGEDAVGSEGSCRGLVVSLCLVGDGDLPSRAEAFLKDGENLGIAVGVRCAANARPSSRRKRGAHYCRAEGAWVGRTGLGKQSSRERGDNAGVFVHLVVEGAGEQGLVYPVEGRGSIPALAEWYSLGPNGLEVSPERSVQGRLLEALPLFRTLELGGA